MKKLFSLLLLIFCISCSSYEVKKTEYYMAYKDFDDSYIKVKNVKSICYSKQKAYYRVIYYKKDEEKVLYLSDNFVFITNCKINGVVEF